MGVGLTLKPDPTSNDFTFIFRARFCIGLLYFLVFILLQLNLTVFQEHSFLPAIAGESKWDRRGNMSDGHTLGSNKKKSGVDFRKSVVEKSQAKLALMELCQWFVLVKFRHIPRIHNEIADALATLSSMLQHPDKAYIDPVHIQSRDQHAYCNVVEEELDGEPWFLDIKRYIQSGEYPAYATNDQKRTIRRLASGFFLSGRILYKRTPDLGLLRCVDAKEASTIMVHGDLIRSPPVELHAMAAPWPFVAWGMDVIGPIEPKASNEHRFILVAIDYFTKWVEAVSFKSVTKKAVVDFVHANIICRFGIPKMIIQTMLPISIVIWCNKYVNSLRSHIEILLYIAQRPMRL
ncbi:hypothetical protein T459_08233 [Capsicum annuum]|uniref:Integrase catalytic domain-containing protein n=1 Tax=Capsicum annuum TaxID=4072 RepID=A0A2G2ZVY1_CAPAN|nr:hypothetical protein T459_08233 [Capsicum annuum]